MPHRDIAEGYKAITRRLSEHFDLPPAPTVIDTTATDASSKETSDPS
jgi:hypothetical protein